MFGNLGTLQAEYYQIVTDIVNERATLVRASRVVIHSIFVLGPSVRGKITSVNGNLRNLRYTKNNCHVKLALITSESAHPITLVEPLKPRF